MKLVHGVVAFLILMGLAAALVYTGKLHAEVFAVPAAAFAAWLMKQPIEMRQPDAPKGTAKVNGLDQPETD